MAVVGRWFILEHNYIMYSIALKVGDLCFFNVISAFVYQHKTLYEIYPEGAFLLTVTRITSGSIIDSTSK